MGKTIKRRMEERGKRKRILAVYDFAACPVTFDIPAFLLILDNWRTTHGYDKIDIVFVAHKNDPVPDRCKLFAGPGNFSQFLHNIVLESVRLFDFAGNVYIFDNRDFFTRFYEKFRNIYLIYPEYYDPFLPLEFRIERPPSYWCVNMTDSEIVGTRSISLSLRPADAQVKIVRKWLLRNVYPKIPVTLTLRECKLYSSGKNTDIAEFQKLIDYYRGSDILFIVLGEYYNLYEKEVFEGDNVLYYNEAVVTMAMRTALYQEATLNIFTNNGCSVPAIFNVNASYLIFKIITDVNATRPRDLKYLVGLNYGDDFPGATKYQKYVWEPDSFEIIQFNFEKMMLTLKKDNKWIPAFYENQA